MQLELSQCSAAGGDGNSRESEDVLNAKSGYGGSELGHEFLVGREIRTRVRGELVGDHLAIFLFRGGHEVQASETLDRFRDTGRVEEEVGATISTLMAGVNKNLVLLGVKVLVDEVDVEGLRETLSGNEVDQDLLFESVSGLLFTDEVDREEVIVGSCRERSLHKVFII
jgi:hypothetical protein